ncbi:unnamed protein product, partial [Rotaria magnacalcarata]
RTPAPIDSSPESSSRSSGIYSTVDLHLSDLSSSSLSSDFHASSINGNNRSHLVSSSKFDFYGHDLHTLASAVLMIIEKMHTHSLK